MEELPKIWLDLSSFVDAKNGNQAEFNIKKKFLFQDHRFTLRKPLKGKITIQKTQNNTLIACFSIGTQITFHCDRCLKPIEKKLKLKFKRVIRSHTKEDEIKLLPNKKIEVFEPIWQELILKIPPRILCHPNCQGICPICGTNWNEKSCPHKKKTKLKKQPSPFEKLKKQLKNKSN